MWDRSGAMPAPPPMNTISASLSRAKNSPNGPAMTTVSPGERPKIHEDTAPGGVPAGASRGGGATRTLSMRIPVSPG